MLIEIHAIQNHSPANLNRDDLGAPKTCYFGGVLRSRISSQCLKRSIRLSKEFQQLLGGVRTRQLAKLISDEIGGAADVRKRAEKILDLCGMKPKKEKNTDDTSASGEKSKMLVYTTREAIREMAALLCSSGKSDEELMTAFGTLISEHVAVPDMALSGRMFEPNTSDKATKALWQKLKTTVDAALQVAHAISTHEARPEVDYYVAADDEPGDDAGAGYVDEALFASACFYKYFAIDWDTLCQNLEGNKALAAHTVGAFIRGAALTTPTGKQNSFAAHNRPDGMLIQFTDSPVSYANAFARPVARGERDLIEQSIAQLGQYILDLDTGFGKPSQRFWFSPNLRYALRGIENAQEIPLTEHNIKSLDDLVPSVVAAIGFDWAAVQQEIVNPVGVA